MIKAKQQGLVAILSANTIFGLNIPVTKSLVASWMTPIAYTASRMIFGALVFWSISTLLRKEKVKGKDLIIMLLSGLLGYLGTQFLFSQSLKYTTPVIFSILMALTPVVVLTLAAIFLKENVPLRKIVGILLSVFGAAFIILAATNNGESGADNFKGIFYAILCVIAYSAYLVITRNISIKYKPVTIAKWMFLISTVVVIPFSLPELQAQKIYSYETTGLAISLLAFALLFSTILAFFLLPYALKRLEASTVSIFMNLQPIVASVIAIVVGQDNLTWDKPIAVILVITGVYLVTVEESYHKVNRKSLWELLKQQNVAI